MLGADIVSSANRVTPIQPETRPMWVQTLVAQQLGLRDAVHVPYKGGAMAMNDLLGGHVDLAVMTMTSYLPHARQPDVKALAVTSAQRLDLLPQVPTFAELGFKGMTALTWFSLSTSKGVGSDVAQWASAALRRLYATESVQARIRQNGVSGVVLKPEQALVFMREEWERWGKAIASIPGK
jgi:tripartite-type tricarboxylate transporter receptor subunit TctC